MTDNGRVKKQFWVDINEEMLERAKKIADEKRITFSGFVGLAVEKYTKELESEVAQ